MPRRNPVTKTEDRLTKQRMITRVAGSPPYEWVAWAIEQYATKVRKERSPACCELLDRGLNRDLSELRVIRTFAEKRGRGVVAESGGRDPMIQSFSAAGRYGNLPQRVEKALGVLRKQHVARAKAGAAQLSKLARSRQFPVVRGWRNVVERRDVDLSGLVLQIAGTGEIPQQALFDVCDCASDDMVSADVIRAIFADELTREGLAPDGWRERVAVHRGWVQFGDREVR
jgi:Pyruvate dehydrogenase complex, dehydrogenase (E1) component